MEKLTSQQPARRNSNYRDLPANSPRLDRSRVPTPPLILLESQSVDCCHFS